MPSFCSKVPIYVWPLILYARLSGELDDDENFIQCVLVDDTESNPLIWPAFFSGIQSF